MEELLDKYIRHLKVERNLSAFTLRNYSKDISDFLNFLKDIGVNSLENVDYRTVRRYLSWLVGRRVVRASISRKLSTLRSFFRYMSLQGVISMNPLGNLSGPKGIKRLPSLLTLEEMFSLLKAPDRGTPQGLRDQAILELLYATGLRVSEIVSLNVDKANLETYELRVWGKGSKERVVLMGQPAAKALKEYLVLGRPKLLRDANTNALFLNRYGQRITERRIQRILKKHAKRAGISGKVSPHMLRHTFATHMLDGGADLRVVQELLGHANLSSTQVYTHMSRAQMRSTYLKAHPRSRDNPNQAPNR